MKMLVPLALLVAGCHAGGDGAAVDKPAGNAVDAGLNELGEDVKSLPIGAGPPVIFEGEWRVAGINGEEFDAQWTPTATIGEGKIRIQSQCVWFERYYRRDRMRLLPPDPVPVDEPQEMCARGLTAGEEAMGRALRDAEWAYRLPDNSLVLDGPGGSLTLFTQ